MGAEGAKEFELECRYKSEDLIVGLGRGLYPVPDYDYVFIYYPLNENYWIAEYVNDRLEVGRRYININGVPNLKETGNAYELSYLDYGLDYLWVTGAKGYLKLDGVTNGGEIVAAMVTCALNDGAIERKLKEMKQVHYTSEGLYLKSIAMANGIKTEIENSGKEKLYNLYEYAKSGPQEIVVSDIWITVREGDGLALTENGLYDGRFYWPIEFPPTPHWYEDRVRTFKVSDIAQLLGKALIGITPSSFCSFFKSGTACKFCEIAMARVYSADVLRETIQKLAGMHYPYLVITTGNLDDQNEKTWDYLLSIVDPDVLGQFKENMLAFMPPRDADYSQLKERGVQKVVMALEVTNAADARRITPGKARYGYGELENQLRSAVSVFGRGNVYTNMVYGISSPGQLLEKDLELLKDGILPYHTVYHTTGKNAVGLVKVDAGALIHFHKLYLEQVKGFFPEIRHVVYDAECMPNSFFNDVFRKEFLGLYDSLDRRSMQLSD